ncbi:MAG: ribonuclease III, partial [Clostridia bacterium]|nr:ribonuclease III [Clostridia bacterium]
MSDKAYPVSYSFLEESLGYTFKDKSLLVNALTHSSYSNEVHSRDGKLLPFNERLEFLGDSVLGIITSEYLYSRDSQMPEGMLTKTRAKLVCENALYLYAKKISLGDYLYLGRGEEMMDGRNRKSILADAFEALLAAMYIDGGKEPTKQFLMPFLLWEIDRDDDKVKDYKTLLQQITQQMQGEVLEYVLIEE